MKRCKIFRLSTTKNVDEFNDFVSGKNVDTTTVVRTTTNYIDIVVYWFE